MKTVRFSGALIDNGQGYIYAISAGRAALNYTCVCLCICTRGWKAILYFRRNVSYSACASVCDWTLSICLLMERPEFFMNRRAARIPSTTSNFRSAAPRGKPPVTDVTCTYASLALAIDRPIPVHHLNSFLSSLLRRHSRWSLPLGRVSSMVAWLRTRIMRTPRHAIKYQK